MIKKAIALLVATSALASAATINYSTTTTGNRVVTSTSPLTPVSAGSLIRMGSMSNEADFSTFVEFGTSTVNTNAAFPSGGVINASVTNNTVAAADFASKSIYIAIYNAAASGAATFAGIFKSSAIFDATISSSASQTFTVGVSTFTTAINPTTSWGFNTSSVNPAGITGAAGTPPTNRTGIVFTLGAAVPEPSSMGLLVLAGLAAARRRR
jgi:hypothetical protein